MIKLNRRFFIKFTEIILGNNYFCSSEKDKCLFCPRTKVICMDRGGLLPWYINDCFHLYNMDCLPYWNVFCISMNMIFYDTTTSTTTNIIFIYRGKHKALLKQQHK